MCKSEREKERKKRSIMEIWVMCESHYQMHRLSNLYYAHKHYKNYVYPLSSITMLSGIMAFINSTSILNEKNKEYLSLAVGFTAVLSSFIQNLGQEAKDDTKAEMHKSATLGMKKIADQLDFELMQVDQEGDTFQQKPKDSPKENGGDGTEQPNTDANARVEDAPEEKNSIQTYQEMYQQCLESCQSQIPVRISQAFKMADSRLKLSLSKADKERINEKFGRVGNQIIYRSMFSEVFCAISRHPRFPRSCPKAEDIIDGVMSQVKKSYSGDRIDFTTRRR